jgi:hypothetical protein
VLAMTGYFFISADLESAFLDAHSLLASFTIENSGLASDTRSIRQRAKTITSSVQMLNRLSSLHRTRPSSGTQLGSDPFQLPVRDNYATRSTIVGSRAPHLPPLYRPLPRLSGDPDSTSTSVFRSFPARPPALVKREADPSTKLGKPLSKKEVDELCRVNEDRLPVIPGQKYTTPGPTPEDLLHLAPRKSAALLFCDIVGGGL